MNISFMRKSWQLEISSLKKETNVLIHFCINLNWNLLIRKLLFTGTQIIHVHWSLTDWSNLAYTIKKLIFQNYQIVTNYSHLFFKTTFSKTVPKEMMYRNFKIFDQEIFSKELRSSLSSGTVHNYTKFGKNFSRVLNKHTPSQKRAFCGNHAQYVTKALKVHSKVWHDFW